MSLTLLFFEFAEFGALAFGGGLTILPLLFDTFVEQQHIFTAPEFGNLISVAQITPGPITINIATFTGYLSAGVLGAVIASLGLIFPSLIITGIALFFLEHHQHSWIVRGFLKGAYLVALVMVLYAAVLFGSMSVLSEPWPIKDIFQTITSGHFRIPEGCRINYPELGIFLISLYLMKRGITVTKLIIGSAIFGFCLSFL